MKLGRLSHVRRASEPLLRQAGALLILLALIGPLAMVRPASAGAQEGDFPPDIVAMALTPWDLADAGLDNYGHGFSEMIFIDAFAAQIAANRDMDEDDVVEILDDAGFVRAYYAYLYSSPEDEDVSQVVVSYVIEYEDEDGAADAWEFLEDESDRDDAEDLDGFDDIGDASEATLITGEDESTGDEFAQIDATTMLGNLHTGVVVVDWTGEEPDEDLMAELLDYAVEGVEDGQDADQPAASNQALRLTGDSVEPYFDLYQLRDGEVTWLYGESPEIADENLELAEEALQTELYSVWQRLGSWGDDSSESVWYYLSMRRFEDEDAAADWVALQAGNIESNENFEDAEVDEADIGDGGIVYSASLAGNDDIRYHGATFSFGDFAITLELSAPIVATQDALEALVEEQLICLEDEGCIEPVELPGAVEDFVADAESGPAPDDDETPVPDDEETPEADETPEEEETEQADGGPVIYEGELYPFAVAYNANDWEIVVEEDPADDDEEWIQFLSGSSTVWMVATPQFGADELGDCVDYFRVELGWEDAWELEPLEDLTEDDERAFASYTMTDRLFGLFGYLSIECRPIDSDTVLAIVHFAGTDDEGEVPDDEVDAVEELKDGIQMSGSADGEEDEEEASSSSGGAVYTSEEWGYTVTWDPEYWAESNADLEDGIRLGFRFNTLASVTIFRIESDDDDAESCLDGIIEQANEGDDEGESELIPADDLPVPETADDAAGGVYMLGDFATMYFECRPLADGDGMLRIAFGAPDENWEELLPYLEDVLAGIEITAA